MRAFRWHHRLKDENAAHFISTVTKSRQPIFSDDSIARIVLNEMHEYAKRYDIGLIAAVVMPDHVHAIIWPKGKRTFSEYMKGVKGFTAKKIAEHWRGAGTPPMGIWQDEFYCYLITDEEKLEEKIWYIIRNPVEDRLIHEDGTYPYLYVHPDYDPR